MDHPTVPPTIDAATSQETVPTSGRTLVLCLDGTGDLYDSDVSNIVQFFSALKKDDENQCCYYQSGVGTYTGNHRAKKGISAGLDMAIGSGLGVHIRDGYEYLMNNYREGDRVCLLGFSRGAYTARALAGMLHKVGLLPKGSNAQVPFAYKQFKDQTPNGWEMSRGFKQTFCIDVNIHFLGCFDTVASVGFFPRVLPFSKSSNESVHYFRHALALDERRSKFKQALWSQRSARGKVRSEMDKGMEPDTIENFQIETEDLSKADELSEGKRMTRSGSHVEKRLSLRSFGRSNSSNSGKTVVNGHNGNSFPTPPPQEDLKCSSTLKNPARRGSLAKALTQAKLEDLFNRDDALEDGAVGRETDISEVWFAGVHADCGGGSVPNGTRHQLARIPLRWMIRETFKCNTGIKFYTHVLAELGMDVETLFPVLIPRAIPVCGPNPSSIDAYARGSLPPLHERARDYRKHFKLHSTGESLGNFPGNLNDSKTFQDAPEGLPERDEDFFDALSPINDQLIEAKGWWVLEYWPIKKRKQNPETLEWEKSVGFNKGMHRTIRSHKPKLHYSVITRQEHLGYKIKNPVNIEATWDIVI